MKRLLIILMAISFLAISSCAMVDQKIKKELVNLKKPVSAKKPVNTKGLVNASVIIPLKLKGLEWKLKYYQEKSLVAQLRSMILTWNKQEFQETQRTIRETNKEIQRLLLLK